jgi:hypothetical protein
MTELLKDGQIPSASEFLLWMLLSTIVCNSQAACPEIGACRRPHFGASVVG